MGTFDRISIHDYLQLHVITCLTTCTHRKQDVKLSMGTVNLIGKNIKKSGYFPGGSTAGLWEIITGKGVPGN